MTQEEIDKKIELSSQGGSAFGKSGFGGFSMTKTGAPPKEDKPKSGMTGFSMGGAKPSGGLGGFSMN